MSAASGIAGSGRAGCVRASYRLAASQPGGSALAACTISPIANSASSGVSWSAFASATLAASVWAKSRSVSSGTDCLLSGGALPPSAAFPEREGRGVALGGKQHGLDLATRVGDGVGVERVHPGGVAVEDRGQLVQHQVVQPGFAAGAVEPHAASSPNTAAGSR